MSYNPITSEEIRAKCEENEFVRSSNSYYASDGDPMVDVNNEFNVARYDSLEELEKAFLMYDAHRQCFIYKNLVFVNSTLGGGWEAWTLKKFGDNLIAFESISMGLIIREGKFKKEIDRLLKITEEQARDYWNFILNDED